MLLTQDIQLERYKIFGILLAWLMLEVLQLVAEFIDSSQIDESEVTGFTRSSDMLAGRKKSRR